VYFCFVFGVHSERDLMSYRIKPKVAGCHASASDADSNIEQKRSIGSSSCFYAPHESRDVSRPSRLQASIWIRRFTFKMKLELRGSKRNWGRPGLTIVNFMYCHLDLSP
jgi:hypothetical protein